MGISLSFRRILVIAVTVALTGAAWVTASRAASMTLTWTAPGEDSLVGRAARYDLRSSTQMITSEGFGLADSALGMPVPATPGTIQSYTFDSLESGTTYYFAIKTADQAGNWAVMSNVISRVPLAERPAPAPAAPPLILPEDGATGVATEPTLTWQASDGATSYRLQVAQAQDFGSPVVDQGGIVGTSYAISGLANDSTYYWRVQASGEGGLSPWSSVRDFRTVAQTPLAPLAPLASALLSPEDGATGVATEPTLTWQASDGATSYRLQVARAQNFGSPVTLDQGGLVGTSQAVSGLANDATYYWRVRASGEGGVSPWSSTRSFRTVAQTPLAPLAPLASALLSPEDGATGVATEPTLTWQASDGATSYRLQVARVQDFGSLLVDQGGLVGTSQAVSGLANDSNYYWRVQASGDGGLSPWSSVRNFRTVAQTPLAPLAPLASALLSPEDGATGVATEPTLTWQASDGATSYRLQVARAQDFGSPVVDRGGIVGTSQAVSGLAKDSTYYWRVRASGEGGLSPWSSVRDFRTVAETAPLTLPGISFSVPRPNPARDLSRFACSLPVPAQVRIEVFDLAGRRVRLLMDESCAAGRRELAFDLRDDGGQRLVPGVYLVRAHVGSTPFTRRLVIVH
jgi:large repetitive protein